MFKEEEPFYKLKVPKMTCDYQLTCKTIHPPFPNKSFGMLIVGTPGSGKTSFLMSILTQKKPTIYRGVFKDIIIVCPSLASLPSDLLESIPDNQKFSELDEDVKDMIYENAAKYKEEEEEQYSQLLILDDITAWLKVKENVVFLNQLFFNRRHLRLSIILTSQYTTSVPKSLRANVSDLVLFKPRPSEYETIRREFIPISKDKFSELMEQVFQKRFDNLYITESREYFRNLGRLQL